VRKLLSIVLLALLALPFAAPLLAQDGKDSSNLPACCRKKSMHHCNMDMSGMSMDMSGAGMNSSGMDMMEHNADGTVAKWPTMHAKMQCCQNSMNSAAAFHADPSALAFRDLSFHGLSGMERVTAQAETTYRIAQNRARHKRGPPSLSI
jgi:hypothetical protein